MFIYCNFRGWKLYVPFKILHKADTCILYILQYASVGVPMWSLTLLIYDFFESIMQKHSSSRMQHTVINVETNCTITQQKTYIECFQPPVSLFIEHLCAQ